MKLEYICNDCRREISSSQYEEQGDIFCPECGGHIEENTEKIWCFSDTNGQLKGPFYDSDLREAFLNMEIHEQTKMFKLDNLEWKPLTNWDSLKSVTKAVTPVVEEPTMIPAEENTNKTLLLTCASCSHKFSKRAESCPKCGWKPQVICQICQQNIPFDSTVCPECGDPEPFTHEVQHLIPDKNKNIDTKNTNLKEQPAKKVLGTKWLSFWNYFSLPVGGILGILMSVGVPAIAFIMVPIIMVPISIFQLITAVGLHYRKIWAWKANWVAIVLGWLGGAIPNVNTANSNNSLGEFFAVFVILFLSFGVIWIWPNYIYWNKRKYLFVN